MKNTTSINIIRWTARIIGTFMVAFTLVIGIGEMLESYSGKNASLDQPSQERPDHLI